jgi:hypothetical protein
MFLHASRGLHSLKLLSLTKEEHLCLLISFTSGVAENGWGMNLISICSEISKY